MDDQTRIPAQVKQINRKKMNQKVSHSLNTFIRSTTKYVIEFLIVAFGVFLGIYVGNKNTQRKTDVNTRNALIQIVSELETNAQKLEEAIAYHKTIGANLDSITNELSPDDYKKLYFENEKFNYNSIPGWTGIGIADIDKTIYESVKLSGIFNELNVSTIHLLSGIYEYQDFLSDFNRRFLYKLMDINNSTTTYEAIVIIHSIARGDVAKNEIKLLKRIKTNKEKLKKTIQDKAYRK